MANIELLHLEKATLRKLLVNEIISYRRVQQVYKEMDYSTFALHCESEIKDFAKDFGQTGWSRCSEKKSKAGRGNT